MRKRRVRLDPVSCQSCRSKKLKCNRIQPCSNCAVRRITCTYLVPPLRQTRQTEQASTLHVTAEILWRIEKLESIVLDKGDPVERSSGYTSDNGYVTEQQRLQSPRSAAASQIHQDGDEDSRFLESIGARENLVHRLSDGPICRINSTHEILQTHGTDLPKNTVLVLPEYSVATLLLQSYESDVDHLCRILDIPTVRSMLNTCYQRIYQGDHVLSGQAALLLSIFSVAAYFYRPSNDSKVATTKQDAIHLSNVLSRNALDVLDYSRRNTSGTLEDVQASILMSFVTYHLQGYSARGRLLLTMAASIAIELRLHRVDANIESSSSENQLSVRSLIDLEVKRRVFWYIAATDWLLSTISGPQEGMYFIHPSQMKVNLPEDLTDDGLILSEDNEPTTRSRPTGVTLSVERIRLAHLCREMTDTVPLEISNLMSMPYEKIITLDKKLQDFISGVPFFYKPDTENRRKSKSLEIIYPEIPVGRYYILAEAHNRRCKLHQRFVHRQSVDPRYDYSRQACLESARAVIRSYKDLQEYSTLSTVPELMRMAVRFTHLALVVMVMDLCFNRDKTDEVQIKAEVKAALQMFEHARDSSPLVGRFLSSLSDILKKHKVRLAYPFAMVANNVASAASAEVIRVSNNAQDEYQMQYAGLGRDIQDPANSLDPSFDEFWQMAIQYDSTMDSLAWDNLLSVLDSRQF